MKLIVEPHDGARPLLSAIEHARKSVDLVIFRLDREDIEAALKAAVQRGVRVTALIAHKNRGGEKNLRRLEYRFLEAGIAVMRSADDLIRYHDKFILIDERALYLLSFNFTHLDIERSRGFGVATRNAKVVQEAAKLFRADCSRKPYVPATDAMVVSPENARKVLGAFLGRARKQLLIYDPKISDGEMLGILRERSEAGVEVRVIGKCAGRERFVSRKLAGAQLHTRTIIRDRSQAFIGSQSLRAAELDSRRELGLIVRDSKVVKRLLDVFESDWNSAEAKPKREAAGALEVPEVVAPNSEGHKAAAEEEKDKEKAVETLVKELNPLAQTVKTVVRKAVKRAGEDVLADRQVKDTMKKVVKKAVKTAVKEVVEESGRNGNAG
jgi:cardiolipin synthase A/B